MNKSKCNKLPVDRSCPPLSHSNYDSCWHGETPCPKDLHLNKNRSIFLVYSNNPKYFRNISVVCGASPTTSYVYNLYTNRFLLIAETDSTTAPSKGVLDPIFINKGRLNYYVFGCRQYGHYRLGKIANSLVYKYDGVCIFHNDKLHVLVNDLFDPRKLFSSDADGCNLPKISDHGPNLPMCAGKECRMTATDPLLQYSCKRNHYYCQACFRKICSGAGVAGTGTGSGKLRCDKSGCEKNEIHRNYRLAFSQDLLQETVKPLIMLPIPKEPEEEVSESDESEAGDEETDVQVEQEEQEDDDSDDEGNDGNAFCRFM